MDRKFNLGRIVLAASLTCGTMLKTLIVGTTVGLLTTTAGAQDIPANIEEIIVVVTRREASVQDVPVAVTAITGTMLEDSGVFDVYALQEQAPGLVISRSQQSTTASFAIRGVGTSSQNSGLESSVGLYVDEVYRPRQSSIINNLVDMQSVEVMRGPQGTLFGKNTPSGAILFRTVAPTGTDGRAASDANGFAEVIAGDYGLLNFSAAGNIPMIEDVLAMRATMFFAQRDGYVNDVDRGEDRINDINRYGGRLQLAYTPNDQFSMRVIADYSEIDEVCCAALTRQDSIMATDRPGVFGTDAALLALGGTVFTGDQFDDRLMALNKLPSATNEDKGLSVQFDYDFATTTLTSITAYREFDTLDDIDVDFSDVSLFEKSNEIEQSSFSQEFRFAGEFGERTRYVAGAFYFSQDITSDAMTNIDGPVFSQYLSLIDERIDPVLQFVNGIAAATAGVPTPPGPLPPAGQASATGTFARDLMVQDHSSWAVFAQMDFDLSDSFTLTAGVRYTDEQKDMTGTFTQNPLGAPPDLTAILTEAFIFQSNPAAYNPYSPSSLAALGPVRADGWSSYFDELNVVRPRPNVTESLQDDQVSGTVKLTWFASDDIMFYGSYGTGYKSGGTNTDRIPPGFSYIFGPETSQSYELGMKGTYLDRRLRLNIAAHKTDVDDLQANSFTGAGFNLQNAGKAKTHGAEVEMLWRPTDNFDLQVAYTWSVAEFEEFLEGTCWKATPFHTGVDDPGRVNPTDDFCDRSGGLLPSNPEHNVFLAGTLDFQIGGDMLLFIRPELNYYSETMTDGNNDPLKFRDSFQIWNLRAGLEFESIDTTVTVWGRNLADESAYETVFDVPLQDGKLNAYPREARTFGVTLRKDF